MLSLYYRSAKLQYLSGQELKPPKCHACNQCNSHLASTQKMIFLMYYVYGSTRTGMKHKNALTTNSISALYSRIKSDMLKFENSFIELTCFTIFRTSSYMSIRLTQQQVLLQLRQHCMQKPMRLHAFQHSPKLPNCKLSHDHVFLNSLNAISSPGRFKLLKCQSLFE